MGWQGSTGAGGPSLSEGHLEELAAAGRLTPTLAKLVGAPELK